MMRFHIIGIGGAGMSAIARIMLVRGHTVTGSDTGPWPLAMALARDGATVYQRFDPMNVVGAEVVVRSSAYTEDNPEVRAALDSGMTVWKREDAWRFLTKGQRVVAIAGTHGKSTTTAMTWTALRAGGIDASLICGAVIRGFGTNAYSGTSDVFVIEADEYDNAFLALRPEVAVVTTLDHDHIDVFPTKSSYDEAFRRFVGGIDSGGTLIASADDAGARDLAAWTAAQHTLLVTTYGRDASATTTLRDVGNRVYDLGGRVFGLSIPGWHNALNAAAAILVTEHFKVPTADVIAKGIAPFGGVERRLEELGRVRDILVVDDYAHHPAELAASMAAVRPEGHELIVIFQPHTPSRLEAFFDDFEDAFQRPNGWIPGIIVETFSSAREGRDPKGLAHSLADGICGFYARDGEVAAREAVRIAKPGDVILVMGAGDMRPVGERVLELLRAPV